MTDRVLEHVVVRRVPYVAQPRRSLTPGALIQRHWETLGGSPGNAVSGVERAGRGYRVRYENGTIYVGAGAAWVYGAIGARYDEMGGPESWLGLPVADEAEFAEGGRVSVFQNGAIYWWPDVGAIELNEVVVHYTGLVSFGETSWDQGSDSDEPYVILGVVAPQGSSSTRTAVYQDVDSGESRTDLIEIYRGKPYGINISTLLMENDEGDPDKYKDAMTAAVGAAATGLDAAIAAIPVVGPPLAGIAAPALAAAVPVVATELNRLLDTADDKLGEATQAISPKQMVVLAARTANSSFRGIGFKLETPLLSDGDASYKAYFGFVPA